MPEHHGMRALPIQREYMTAGFGKIWGIAQYAVEFEWRLNSHLGCLLSIINSVCAVERGVTSVKCCGQSRQCSISGNFAEVAFGFEHARGGPAQDHGSALPAFDASRDLAHPAEQVFDEVGRREH